MRLDEFLPSAEFGEAHAIWVAAPPERALEAVKAVEPRETALTRLLFAVRVLPARLAGKWKRPRGQSLYELLLDQGFVTLADEPGKELVLGVVGRFWSVRGAQPRRLAGARDFLAFAEPGYAKAAMNFSAEPEGGGTRLRTETRVVTTDAGSRRRFARYWRVVRPGSALIRRDWLRAAKRRAERD